MVTNDMLPTRIEDVWANGMVEQPNDPRVFKKEIYELMQKSHWCGQR